MEKKRDFRIQLSDEEGVFFWSLVAFAHIAFLYDRNKGLALLHFR